MKLEYKTHYTQNEKDMITSIGPEGSGCNVEIPDSEDTIKQGNFMECDNLENVILPDSIKIIDANAFKYCENLKSIKFSNSLKEIESWTFYCCKLLKKIEIPDSIESIDNEAFGGCYNLEKIELPKNLKNLGSSIFYGCINLKTAIINSTIEIPKNTFMLCNSIEKIYITKNAYDLSPDFVNEYKDKIKILDKTLDEFLNEGKSFKEISKIIKVQER